MDYVSPHKLSKYYKILEHSYPKKTMFIKFWLNPQISRTYLKFVRNSSTVQRTKALVMCIYSYKLLHWWKKGPVKTIDTHTQNQYCLRFIVLYMFCCRGEERERDREKKLSDQNASNGWKSSCDIRIFMVLLLFIFI